jgi:hypothetical protein
MNITVKDEIFIAAPQEEVWTYTQDWRRRKEWDATVVEAEVIEERPPLVRVRAPLGVRYLARYKLYDPPRKTSVALEESTWGVFSGGGGSWDYTPTEGGTIFAQTNTIQIRSRVWSEADSRGGTRRDRLRRGHLSPPSISSAKAA